METFFLAFIPLFVAIDPLGTIPFFLSLTEGFSPHERKWLAAQAVATALIFGVIFTFAGNFIFKVLGITPADFQIAGGLLLLIFSIQEVFGHNLNKPTGNPSDNFLGIVPLGIPLIAGPALITTLLILKDQHSFGVILLAFGCVLLITLCLYIFSRPIINFLGEATSRVSAKVVSIFLAGIGIMMIRKGLETILSS